MKTLDKYAYMPGTGGNGGGGNGGGSGDKTDFAPKMQLQLSLTK